MKRKLWIASMSLFVLVIGAARPAKVSHRLECTHYACTDMSGCDLGCNCQYVGNGTDKQCG